MVKITFICVALFGWAFSSFVMSTRPEESQQTDAIQALVRLPASLPSSLPRSIPGLSVDARPTADVPMKSVRINCWDVADPGVRSVDAKWVRIVGRPCMGEWKASQFTLTNETNGYSGTILGGTDRFTTDFIFLDEGANDIVIRHLDENGSLSERKFRFERR